MGKSNLSAYLYFDGNCRQAMTFYQKCLGGELRLQTVGETHAGNSMPARMKHCIVNGTLRKDGFLLTGTDMLGETGLLKGNAVSLLLNCPSEKEAKLWYRRLSAGGRQVQSLATNHFGIMMGALTDKYGHHWLLQCNMKGQ